MTSTQEPSSAWKWAALAVVIVAGVLVAAVLVGRRRRDRAIRAWRSRALCALDDAYLARDLMQVDSSTPETDGKARPKADLAAAELDQLALAAPDGGRTQMTTAVAARLRSLAFAQEAEVLLRREGANASAAQLAEADEVRRRSGADLDAALARLAREVGRPEGPSSRAPERMGVSD